MTNKEKYPKTEDALKEYNEHCEMGKKIGVSEPISFEKWLDKQVLEEIVENRIKLLKDSLMGFMFEALKIDASSIINKDKEQLLKSTPEKKETSEKKETPEPITCPLCGSSETEIEVGPPFPQFHCHHCKAVVVYKNAENYLIDCDITIEELARRIIKSNLRAKK